MSAEPLRDDDIRSAELRCRMAALGRQLVDVLAALDPMLTEQQRAIVHPSVATPRRFECQVLIGATSVRVAVGAWDLGTHHLLADLEMVDLVGSVA